jgi:NADPH:quinone reductase-like Zn-dependent oxidoreductase
MSATNTLDLELMHALRLHEKGGPDHLSYEKIRVPEPGIGDALVRVHAASFTPTELEWPSTWVDRAGHDRRPVIPGHEVSGVVEALGYGSTGFDVGDEVYGLTDWYRDGSFAEVVAVETRNLAMKPASLSHVEAAALPLSGLTAWQALFDHGRLSEGQRVLIHGAGGGVGTLAVQLAHGAGARVVATGRAWARAVAMQLGAEEFLELETERLDVEGPIDVVVDLVGGEVLQRSWHLVREGGVLVSVVEDPRTLEMGRSDARAVFFVVEPSRTELNELGRRVAAGQLKPTIGACLPLEEAAEGFSRKRPGGVVGKVVLEVPGAGGNGRGRE